MGQKGHDVTAFYSPKIILRPQPGGLSIRCSRPFEVYWANWLDNASHTPKYAYTKTWHYKNVDEGERYEEAQANHREMQSLPSSPD
ncbi:hypothetical protein [Duncaniella dubosii]|uniref:hypothetical protein n=1 Tax=Duncaniella dubosii TaxID=2518971 RepID=UPI003F6665B7